MNIEPLENDSKFDYLLVFCSLSMVGCICYVLLTAGIYAICRQICANRNEDAYSEEYFKNLEKYVYYGSTSTSSTSPLGHTARPTMFHAPPTEPLTEQEKLKKSIERCLFGTNQKKYNGAYYSGRTYSDAKRRIKADIADYEDTLKPYLANAERGLYIFPPSLTALVYSSQNELKRASGALNDFIANYEIPLVKDIMRYIQMYGDYEFSYTDWLEEEHRDLIAKVRGNVNYSP